MRMDAGLDTGPIVAQERVRPRRDRDDARARGAARRCGRGPARAVARPVARRRSSPRSPQPADGATLTRPLRRDDGRLDPARPASELARQVRAYQPWPGTFVETDAGRVSRSAPPMATRRRTRRPPARHAQPMRRLGTVDGHVLALLEVQPAGGEPMPWAAYLRGRPGRSSAHASWRAGERGCGSIALVTTDARPGDLRA